MTGIEPALRCFKHGRLVVLDLRLMNFKWIKNRLCALLCKYSFSEILQTLTSVSWSPSIVLKDAFAMLVGSLVYRGKIIMVEDKRG